MPEDDNWCTRRFLTAHTNAQWVLVRKTRAGGVGDGDHLLVNLKVLDEKQSITWGRKEGIAGKEKEGNGPCGNGADTRSWLSCTKKGVQKRVYLTRSECWK
jgi:hypothetical protein